MVAAVLQRQRVYQAGRLRAAAGDRTWQLRQGADGRAEAHEAHLRHEGHQEGARQRRRGERRSKSDSHKRKRLWIQNANVVLILHVNIGVLVTKIVLLVKFDSVTAVAL